MLKKITFLLTLSVLFNFCTPTEKKEDSSLENKQEGFNIMAYYVPSSFPVDSLPLDKLTHIIFSFTEVIDNKMAFRGNIEPRLAELVEAGKDYPNLKIMVACGGWGGSEGFSDMADTPEERGTFVNSSMELIKKYNLAGLDMDWEYPGLPGNDNPYKEEDKENFTLLMKELKEAMNGIDENLVLTFASAGWVKYYDHIELNEVMKHADYMNIMTYDFVGGNTPFTAHHTNLGLSDPAIINSSPAAELIDTMDIEQRSTESIVEFCIEKGVDPGQIVIGGAFYGRIWEGVPPNNNGLFQLNRGFKGYEVYRDIKEKYYTNTDYEMYWDESARAPYIYNRPDSLFISFDDVRSIGLKTDYARKKKLGGIMFWQLSQDSRDFELVNTIWERASEGNVVP